MLEAFGLFATAFIATGFMFKDVKWIRILNLIGSVCFVIYGFGIGAIWTGVLNAGMIVINAYHLYKLNNLKDPIEYEKR